MSLADELIADRKKLQRLIDDHEMLKEAIEHSPIKFCVYDANDDLIAWNSAYEKLHSEAFAALYAKDAAARFNYADIVRHELRDKVALEELEQEVSKRVEAQRNSAGEAVDREYAATGWERVTKCKLPSNAVAGFAMDINEIKNAEDIARKAEQRADKTLLMLQDGIDALDAGFVLYDSEDRHVASNEAYKRQFGDIGEEIAACETYEEQAWLLARSGLIPGLEGKEAEFVQGMLHKRRNDPETNKTFQAHDGRWIRQTDTKTKSGNIVGLRTDISEIKQREQNLQAVLANIDYGVAFFDRDLKLQIFNDKFLDIADLQASEVSESMRFRDLLDLNRYKGMYDVDPQDDAAWEAFLQSRESTALTPSDEVREFSMANGRVLLNRSVAIGDSFMMTYFEVTELKEREVALQRAQAHAEAADRAKSEFLANMSHEIRTPMNGVMGMAELLLGTGLEPKQKMFADMIVKSGASLLTIINDILDFSKIDAGQLELQSEPFTLAEAVEDVATLVSTRAAEKNLELIVRVDPSLPASYQGDVGRIRQIITNLLGNAVKFTESGHVYANVSGNIQEDGKASLHFRIEDTGVGIPEDKVSSIFDKFQQVDNSATRKHEGTGLGLSIASSLVELMGGEIGVESTEGVGTTFWFTIALPVEGDVKRRHRVPVDVTGARVLVIDDNSVNRSILSEQMEAWKFEHAEVASGQMGLSFMRQAAQHGLNIDLIVLDYQMPEMSGIEVLNEMRSDAAIANIPVILLTSVDTAGTRAALGNTRLEASLTKPTRSSLMLETMVEVISEARNSGAIEPVRPSFSALAESVANGSEASAAPKPTHKDLAPVDAPFVEFKSPAEEPVKPIEAQAAAVVTASKTGSDLDILVAEDNEVNQMVFTQILEMTDYSFKIVANGKLAVASWKVHRPRLILMDVSMPEMNGNEATQAIREIEAGPDEQGHVTIVGVTAHALTGDKETCFDAGMDDYLPKPVSMDSLRSMLDRYLGGGDQSASLSA